MLISHSIFGGTFQDHVRAADGESYFPGLLSCGNGSGRENGSRSPHEHDLQILPLDTVFGLSGQAGKLASPVD